MRSKTNLIGLLFCLCVVHSSLNNSVWARSEESKDDVYRQYLEEQSLLNFKIEMECFNLKIAEIKGKGVEAQQHIEIKYRARIPQKLKDEESDIKKIIDEINSKISDLESKKNGLKLDAAKYYRGKLPKTFRAEWDKQDSEHYKKMRECRNEIKQIIEEKANEF